MEPRATGVHVGDGTNMPNVKTGSQSRVNIDNPHGYDPLNPEVLRILSPDGEITIRGNYGNPYFKKAMRNLDQLNLRLISEKKISSTGYKQTNGSPIKSEEINEVVIGRK